MNWIIPGTTLTAERGEADHVENLFQSMFLAGGLTLGQVSTITGLEPYAIQNWVKRRYLPSPRNKRYDMEQVCRIININMLKGILTMDQICSLLGYINGDLTDESDDLIDDTVLYFMFVRLASRARYIGGDQSWDDAIEEVTAQYHEPIPGAREKLVKVLKIMLTAWIASRLKQEAENMLADL